MLVQAALRKLLLTPSGTSTDGVLPTKLYPHNNSVDRENDINFKELVGESWSLRRSLLIYQPKCVEYGHSTGALLP